MIIEFDLEDTMYEISELLQKNDCMQISMFNGSYSYKLKTANGDLYRGSTKDFLNIKSGLSEILYILEGLKK